MIQLLCGVISFIVDLTYHFTILNVIDILLLMTLVS